MTSVLLNAFYEMGDKFGYAAAAVLGILFLIIWLVVMFKYLNSSNLND